MADRGWLTYDDFRGRVGETFAVVLGEDRLEMELAEATAAGRPGGRGPDGGERQQFSLVFRGPGTPLLPQGTYEVAHEAFPGLALFLVPIGPDRDGMRYEAVFA